MEVYILDSLYRRNAVVDRFESLLWTERWQDIGDFDLLLPSNAVNRALFVPDVKLALNESRRIMVVETIEDNTDAEERTLLRVKGRSLEKILDERPARPDKSNTTDKPTWVMQGLPQDVALYMLTTVCINGGVDVADVIPFLETTNKYAENTLPAPAVTIQWEQDPDTLFKAIKDICELFELGFRLYRHNEDGKLYFNIYTGNDHTTGQNVSPAVIFTPELETVQNTTRLMTVEKNRTTAYVINEQGFVTVYADNVDQNDNVGLDRRVLVVKPAKLTLENEEGEQVEPTPEEIIAYLTSEGKKELAKQRSLLAFDGEINQRSPYQYGRDYELGDLVEMRDNDGVGNNMRVTEQIFVHDGEGERSYPTLTVDSFIVPGAWDSWLGNRMWADFGASEYWSTQP